MTESKSFNHTATVILTVMVVFAMMPILLIVIASFSSESSLIRNGYTYLPEEWSFDAYYYMVKQGVMIVRSYGVSFLVTFAGTAISVILTTMLAYPMSRKSFKYRNALAFFVFFTMLFNGGIVPSYIMWTKFFQIKNTIWALIIPNLLLSANNVLMIRSYFMTSIPEALYEAAKIDGAGHTKIFFQITFPLGKPILVTMGLFSALAYWNDWTNGLYYLSGNQGQKLYSIQNLLNQMITDIQYLASGKVAGNIGAEVAKLPTTSIRMAIAFIAMLPLFIIYPFLQKYFAEGITLGAVKG